MKLSRSFLAAAIAASTCSAAAVTSRQAEDFCGQWDTAEKGDYIIYNNLWGQDSATDGSQCTGVDSLTDGTLAWHSSWTWTGGQGQVKSYPNAALVFEPLKLSAVSSIPTTFKWNYKGDNLIANVAFDMFLASTADGDAEYEIMIWLGALGGAGPISSTGSPIANPNLAGAAWDLYYGLNGQMEVYSFVVPSGERSGFSADVMPFVNFLMENHDLSAEQFLNDVQGGTEPFEGTDAVFTVTAYSATIS